MTPAAPTPGKGSAKTQDTARKIRQKANESAMRARNVKRGRVLKVRPLRIELFQDDRILDEDEDLDVGQWLRFYHKEYGIKKGDTAIVMRENGEWTATDVISTTSLTPRWLIQAGGNDGGDPSHDHR